MTELGRGKLPLSTTQQINKSYFLPVLNTTLDSKRGKKKEHCELPGLSHQLTKKAHEKVLRDRTQIFQMCWKKWGPEAGKRQQPWMGYSNLINLYSYTRDLGKPVSGGESGTICSPALKFGPPGS